MLIDIRINSLFFGEPDGPHLMPRTRQPSLLNIPCAAGQRLVIGSRAYQAKRRKHRTVGPGATLNAASRPGRNCSCS